jgi:hypothetical protein
MYWLSEKTLEVVHKYLSNLAHLLLNQRKTWKTYFIGTFGIAAFLFLFFRTQTGPHYNTPDPGIGFLFMSQLNQYIELKPERLGYCLTGYIIMATYLLFPSSTFLILIALVILGVLAFKTLSSVTLACIMLIVMIVAISLRRGKKELEYQNNAEV